VVKRLEETRVEGRPLISSASAQVYLTSKLFGTYAPREAAVEAIFWLGDYGTVINDFGNFQGYLKGPLRVVATALAESLWAPMQMGLNSQSAREPSQLYMPSKEKYFALIKLRDEVMAGRLGLATQEASEQNQKFSRWSNTTGRPQGYFQATGDLDKTGRLEHFLYHFVLSHVALSVDSPFAGKWIGELSAFSELALRKQNQSPSDFRMNYLGQAVGTELNNLSPANREVTMSFIMHQALVDDSMVQPIISGPIRDFALASYFETAYKEIYASSEDKPL